MEETPPPSVLAAVQPKCMRVSLEASYLDPSVEPFPYQRSWVFRPSLKRIMTREVLAGTLGGEEGSPGVSICQPWATPIAWLVEPDATMALTLVLRVVQS